MISVKGIPQGSCPSLSFFWARPLHCRSASIRGKSPKHPDPKRFCRAMVTMCPFVLSYCDTASKFLRWVCEPFKLAVRCPAHGGMPGGRVHDRHMVDFGAKIYATWIFLILSMLAGYIILFRHMSRDADTSSSHTNNIMGSPFLFWDLKSYVYYHFMRASGVCVCIFFSMLAWATSQKVLFKTFMDTCTHTHTHAHTHTTCMDSFIVSRP
jgi:hypothetical protein